MIRNTVMLLFFAVAVPACMARDSTVNSSMPASAGLAQPSAGAVKTPSGLVSQVVRAGNGSIHPGPRGHVLVHWTGWTTDGQMFDSSVARGEPQSFDVEDVIPGWAEGLQLMVLGEKRRFWIPANLAYDSFNRPGAPRGTLVFDIELLAIQ